ncbi:MAG: hypothetical protein ACLFVG_00215 [Candidatus Aminicenantes bacterium]
MKVLASFGKGLKEAVLQPKMVGMLWFINFMFGSVIFYLFYKRLTDVVGDTLTADKLLKKFDYHFFFEFLVHSGQALSTILFVALVLMVIYFLVSVFLYGGILYSLVHTQKSASMEPERKGFGSIFFQGCGKFLWRFFRLAVYSLLLWLIFVVFFSLMGQIVKAVTAKGTHEKLAFYLFLVEVALGLFLVFLIKMIMDYTRIRIVTEDTRFVFRSLLNTLKFVFKKFGKTLPLYYLLLLTGFVLFAIYWLLKAVIPYHSLLTILIIFVVYQLYMASREWLRIAFQAAQLDFFSLAGI